MKPGQTARFVCEECLVAFEITLAPRNEWPEGIEDEGEHDMDVSLQEGIACPFCLSTDVKAKAVV